MAASKDILFWTPKGEILFKSRRIPVTSIADLIEYILLPYNAEVSKPRALNTFLDSIAELGINKRLRKNKKILADLVLKENEMHGDEEHEDSVSESSNQDSDESETSEGEQGEEIEENEQEDENSNQNVENGEQNKVACQNCCSYDHCHILVVKWPRCKWEESLISPQPN